jgi:hypothetical protein
MPKIKESSQLNNGPNQPPFGGVKHSQKPIGKIGDTWERDSGKLTKYSLL